LRPGFFSHVSVACRLQVREAAPIRLSLRASECAPGRIKTFANVSFSTPGYELDSPLVALTGFLPFLFIPI
jgi:hypothetical protein